MKRTAACPRWMLGLAISVALVFAGSAHADFVLNLQDGANGVGSDGSVFFAGNYDGTLSTRIREYNNFDYGGAANMQVLYGAAGGTRSLVSFDLTSVAAYLNAHPEITVTGATITMYQQNIGGSGSFALNAYQITDANAGWGVGIGNGTNSPPVLVSGATAGYKNGVDNTNTPGNPANSGTAWAGGHMLGSPGGAGLSNLIASITFDAAASTGTAYVFDIDSDGSLMTHWMTVANAGVLFWQPDSGVTTPAGFWGDKSTTAAYRPVLSITYTVVPEPASIGLVFAGSLMFLRRRR